MEFQKYKLMVNGQSMEIVPMRANGVAKFANLIGKTTLDGRKLLRELKIADGSGDFIFGLLAALTEESLLALGCVLTGFPKEFVEENFALDWLADALVYQYENANIKGAIANFTRLASQITE
jgi:hypothetical protein